MPGPFIPEVDTSEEAVVTRNTTLCPYCPFFLVLLDCSAHLVLLTKERFALRVAAAVGEGPALYNLYMYTCYMLCYGRETV